MTQQVVLEDLEAPNKPRNILVVDADPEIRHLLTRQLLANPHELTPTAVSTAEEALIALAEDSRYEFLLTDVVLPGIDGVELLLRARDLRPDLKIIVMTGAPSAEVFRAALACGAIRFLTKPVDIEDLSACFDPDQPGAVAHLDGDLGLLDLLQLSAACTPEGGLRIQHCGGSGLLLHRGPTLVHAMVDGTPGAPGFRALYGTSPWFFESFGGSPPPPNCELDLTAVPKEAPGANATGHLRGLTLRCLIDWAMRGTRSCTLAVRSLRRSGTLTFEAGKIVSAEAAGREGGRAAAEILEWRQLQVEVIQSRHTEAPASPACPASRAGLARLLDEFSTGVDGFVATSVVRRKDRSVVAGKASAPSFDHTSAATSYTRFLECHLAAVELLGGASTWGETEDLLVVTSKAFVLIRLLGEGHFHWLAVSSEANLAMCRHLMRSFSVFLISGLADLPAPRS